jgi:hypothetical protein
VPTEFPNTALQLGEQFVSLDIEDQGKNALEFHIAFYLGEFLAASPTTNCIVLSKDKGFDPLIKHLCGRGFHVQRMATLGEACTSASPAPQTQGACRTPLQSLRQKIPAAVIQSFIDQLIVDKQPIESKQAITYNF